MCNNVALLLTSHLPSMQSRGRDRMVVRFTTSCAISAYCH